MLDTRYLDKGKISFILPSLEKEVKKVLDEIHYSKSIGSSLLLFDLLDEYQKILAKIYFKENIQISPYLVKFTKVFDRLDDKQYVEYLYNQILKELNFLLDT